MTYNSLYEFTEVGMSAFERVFNDQLDEAAIDPTDSALARRVEGTRPLTVTEFATAKDMAAAVLAAIGPRPLAELVPCKGLWAWLAFVMRDVLFPKDATGRRKFGEVHRWYPSDPNDWQKGQRHLVRMPVLLLFSLGRNADHLLCTEPSVLPEIREQLTSQQDMFQAAFQAAARKLYYDDAKEKLKLGAGGKGGGSPRRLAKVRQQFDVTWDLYNLPSERFIEFLPREFDRFKAAAEGAR